jgi:hypothetical protein
MFSDADFDFAMPEIPDKQDHDEDKLMWELTDFHRMRCENGLRIQALKKECPKTIRNKIPKIHYNQDGWFVDYPDLLEEEEAIKAKMAQYQAGFEMQIQNVLADHFAVVIKAMERKITSLLEKFPQEEQAEVNNITKAAGKKLCQDALNKRNQQPEMATDEMDESQSSEASSSSYQPSYGRKPKPTTRGKPFNYRGARGGYGEQPAPKANSQGGPRGRGNGRGHFTKNPNKRQ